LVPEQRADVDLTANIRRKNRVAIGIGSNSEYRQEVARQLPDDSETQSIERSGSPREKAIAPALSDQPSSMHAAGGAMLTYCF
jgi:hypothetical protein